MKVKNIIFDLDGTLLDTVEDLADASNEVLRMHGFPVHDVEKYNTFVGDGLRVLMERITPGYAKEEIISACCETFMKVYARCWDKKTKPYPGIEMMLGDLKARQVSCNVLSNKPHVFTTECVKRFFQPETFDYVFGQRDGVPRKPDPAGALELAQVTKTPTDQCVYIGDTSVDMQTGKKSGMFTIGVLWGFRGEKELIENGADLIVSTPEEIVEYVVAAC